MIQHIFHLSDVHIRLYKRHDEYRNVFQTLYTRLNSDPRISNSIIVITGDIVHSKLSMSPEQVQLTSEFFTKLSQIAPVVVIPGNHDLSLSNKDRLDALTPIIDNLDNSSITYYKQSGVYTYKNIKFHNFSLLDDKWPTATDYDPSYVNVGLYHGAINLAQSDTGHSIVSEIETNQFKHLDMVLLGDIHKTQYVETTPEIFYVGSLIQQNHGEELTSHGVAVWDIADKKVVDFIHIPNNIGYYTLDVSPTSIPTVPSNLPSNLRVRVIDRGVNPTIISTLYSDFKKIYTVLEWSVQKRPSMNTVSSNSSITLANIGDPKYQNQLLADYLSVHHTDVQKPVIDALLTINNETNNAIDDDATATGIQWSPKTIKFDNLFSFGEGNSIDFSNKTGVYGIFSPNASGKSTAFDVLCFALYDKTPRAFKGSHIMNVAKNTFYCQFIFTINGIEYVIERTGERKKSGDVKVDVNFYSLTKAGEKIALNGTDRRDTNAIIRSFVGSYENFVLTALSVQNQNTPFIETGQTDRKELLIQFTGFTIFDKLYTAANTKLKELNAELKAQLSLNHRDEYSLVVSELLMISSRQSEYEQAKSSIQNTLSELTSRTAELYSKLIPTVDVIDIDPVTENKVKCEKDLSSLYIELQTIQRTIATKTSQLELVDGYRLTADANVLVEKKNSLTKTISALQHESQILFVRMEESENTYIQAQKIKYDPGCPYCLANPLIVNLREIKDKYDTQCASYKNLQIELTTLSTELEQLTNSTSELHQRTSNQLQYDILVRELDQFVNKETSLKLRISKAELELAKYNEQITLYTQNKLALEQNKTTHADIVATRMEEAKQTKQLQNTIDNLTAINSRHALLTDKKEQLTIQLAKLTELENQIYLYGLYTTIIGRDGLPYKLITDVLPTIELEINAILSQVVSFVLSLEIDDKNITAKIVYDSDRTWPLELASGMEKFISSLAIRIALMSISNLPRCNFLIIDEGFGALDSDTSSSISILFDILRTKLDFIILISHLDIVKDLSSQLIDIQKINGVSSINA